MNNTIEEVDFISPCPVQDCINEEKPIRWKHSNCGGYEKITNKGEIKCVKCGTSGLFIDWQFKCEKHSFKKSSAQGVAHALSIMAQLSVNPEEQLFIALLMTKVGQQFLNQR